MILFWAQGIKKKLLEQTKLENILTWVPVVAAALRGADGRFLLHRRALLSHHGGLWEFPGGKVEIGENPSFAMVRELEEELGIRVDTRDLKPVGFAESAAEENAPALVILLYISSQWRGDPQALVGEEIGWFTPCEIAELAKPPLDSVLAEHLARIASGGTKPFDIC